MVNKKLTQEDEEAIYYEWLAGKPLSVIASKYPVVISTVQRVIKKKSRSDGTKRNCILNNIFRHLKNANEPLEIALRMCQMNDENIHEKQKEFMLDSLGKLSENIETLVNCIQKMEI